jgi:hypothetical protein
LGTQGPEEYKPGFVWHIGRWGAEEAAHERAEIREESGPIYWDAKTMIGIMCSFSFWNFMIWYTHTPIE